MHPVIQGFVESIQISRDSAGLLEAIEDIRGRPILSIAVRANALRNLDLIQPFSVLLDSIHYPRGMDLYVSLWGGIPEKEITLWDFLSQKVGSYGFLSNTPASKGLLLATGADEMVLGDHVGFLPFHQKIKTGSGELSLKELLCFMNEFSDRNPLDYFQPESVISLLSAARTARERFQMIAAKNKNTEGSLDLERFLQRYVESPPGDFTEISRNELKEFGMPVRFGEEAGILGSMRELQNIYTGLVCMSTNMEGTHQFPQGHPAGNQAEREYSFKARAELQGIVESAQKRLICFRVTGLPPEQTEEVVWIQK